MSNPFPSGLVQPSGNTLGLLTGVGSDVYFVDPNKGAPRVQQYSVDLQRELPGGISVTLGYTGLTGSNMSWGGSGNALININQLDPKYQTLVARHDDARCRTRFSASRSGSVRVAGQTCRSASCCARSRSSPTSTCSSRPARTRSTTPAIFQMRKRVTGLWGGNFSYTYSRLNDNQFGQSNYYSSAPGLQNNYTVIPGSPYYNPDQEYGRSLLDSPHKIVIAPTLLVPFGEGQQVRPSGSPTCCSAAGQSRR